MMDYMYRGEVNISQDQLAALLKAAESLQIKGLSDNRGGSSGGNGSTSQKNEIGKLPPPVPAQKVIFIIFNRMENIAILIICFLKI